MIFKLNGNSIILVTKEEFEKSGKNLKKYFFLPKKIDFYNDINKKITKRDYLENIRTICIFAVK